MMKDGLATWNWRKKKLSDLTGRPSISLRDFETGIGYILDQLGEAPGLSDRHLRLVILLDEIDDALERPWTNALFSQLRALIYSSDMSSRVRLMIAGSHRFLEQVNMRGSPLWNVLKLHYLEPFTEIDIKELTKHSEKDISDAGAIAVFRQSGGHPFLAQYLLHHLWEQDISQVTYSKVDEVATKFLAEQIEDVEGWAKAVGVGGLEAYRILNEVDKWIGERQIISAINEPSLNVKRGLIALCYHGLALHDDSWAKYRRTGDIFWKWYDNYGAAFTASLAGQNAVTIQSSHTVSRARIKGLTWLHLSDWHQEGKEFDRQVVRDALLEDIERRTDISPDLAEIDFVVFSGDVAFGGQSEDYEDAIEQLFDPILQASEVDHDKVFIVPGNHDLDRDAFDLLPSALLKPLESEKEIQNWLTDE